MKAIIIIIKKELRKIFLDRRALLSTILLPGFILFITYTMIGQISKESTSSIVNTASKIMLVGDEADFNYLKQLSEAVPNIKISLTHELSLADEDNKARQLVNDKDYDLVVILKEGETLPVFQLYYNNNTISSAEALSRFQSLLELTRQPTYLLDVVNAGEDEGFFYIIAMIAPMIIVMMLISGAMTICADSIAGEKERKTIGLLLLTPIARWKIAISKIAANSVSAFAAAISSFIGLACSLPFAGNMFAAGNVSYQIGDYLLILVVIICTALFIVSLLTFISTFAKTTKEATALITPVYLVGVIVAIIPSISGNVSDNIYLSFIPIYNTTLAIRQIMSFDVSAISILFTVLSNLTFFTVLVFAITKLFKKENVLFN